LYDKEKDVAIAHISWEDSNRWFSAPGSYFAEQIEEKFEQQTTKTHIGVFYTPGKRPNTSKEPTDEFLTEAGDELKENLTDQVQKFIKFLYEEGILTDITGGD